MNVQKRTWQIVEVAKPGDTVSRVFDIFILSLIFLNVVAIIIGSVESIEQRYGTFLYHFEVLSVAIFTIEYIARVWSCVADKKYSKAISGRVKFMLHPLPLIDLIAILPFYLPLIGFDLRFMRAFRLVRVIRIAKVGRYYSSLRLMVNVFKSKKEELILTVSLMLLLLVISACFLYHFENPAQPKVFSDIPSTMWWSVVTLTTVGYGDVYPITVWGKIFASVVAILGIGLFALPTGILGAGFIEEIEKSKSSTNLKCPHCGKEINQ